MKLTKVKTKQKKLKNDITSLAHDLGFDDIKFLTNSIASDKNIAVLLFKKYTPSLGKAEPGEIALCEYYICSNPSYFAALDFANILNYDFHVPAQHTKDIKLKPLAIKSGGRVGLNSLYYHEDYGSFINMQCVLITADLPKDNEINTHTECELCGACIKACPTKAITFDGFTQKKCLRDMMSEGIPIRSRRKVYQLLGCDKCQTCCPMNDETRKEPETFDIQSVLKGEQTRHLKELAGKNSATRTRLITQTICYAVSKRDKKALAQINQLTTDDQSEIIKDFAKWGKKELEKIK
jgi:epoxyqueuosine reductase QueG